MKSNQFTVYYDFFVIVENTPLSKLVHTEHWSNHRLAIICECNKTDFVRCRALWSIFLDWVTYIGIMHFTNWSQTVGDLVLLLFSSMNIMGPQPSTFPSPLSPASVQCVHTHQTSSLPCPFLEAGGTRGQRASMAASVMT